MQTFYANQQQEQQQQQKNAIKLGIVAKQSTMSCVAAKGSNHNSLKKTKKPTTSEPTNET